MTPSKILFFFCLSFVVGILLESIIKIPQIFIWGFLFSGILLIFLSLAVGRKLAVLGFCFLFLVLGILRVQISDFNIANDKLSKLNGRGQVVLTGIVFDQPDVRDTSQKLRVKIGGSVVLITTKLYPEYNYLDSVKVTGKLEVPMASEDFNYKDYLLKDHIYSVMNFPKVELVSQKHKYNIVSYLYGKIIFVKEKLNESIQDNFLPPHSLLLEGIILGNNKNMTQDLRDKLNNTGLRFLTAISGVHVVILSILLASLLIFFGLAHNNASFFSIIFIWLYVVLTGFTASGIRAGIMGGIFIFSGVFGRQNTSSRTIVLAAALMLLQNPLLLIYDVGFQLSFVACLGIIYLKPLIKGFFEMFFKGKLRELSNIAAITITAQISTLPIMIYNFGTMSLIAPITNILILPVMPLILSFGFLFSIFAAVSKFLGWIFFAPLWFLISYFIKVMEIFSQPWMVKSITNVSWIWLLIYYFIVALITWLLRKKYGQKFV